MTGEEDKKRVDLVLLICAVTVFLGVAAATLAITLDGLSKVHQGYAEYQENARAVEEATKQVMEQSCFVSDFAVYSKCIREKLGSYYEAQATNQDLQAQKDMAYWAFSLFGLGLFQTFIGLMGIYFVKANLAAVRETNLIARDNAKNESRAYVYAEKCEWLPRGHPQIVVWIKNGGTTPAKWYDVLFFGAVTDEPDRSFQRPPETISARWNALGSGESLPVALYQKDLSQLIVNFNTSPNTAAFEIVGTITYETVFGEVMQTEFFFTSEWKLTGSNNIRFAIPMQSNSKAFSPAPKQYHESEHGL